MDILQPIVTWWERISTPLPVVLEELNYLGFLGGIILIFAFFLSFFQWENKDISRMGYYEARIVKALEDHELKALLMGVFLSAFGLVWTALLAGVLHILYRLFKR